jgi:multiple sugar transport system permease protein
MLLISIIMGYALVYLVQLSFRNTSTLDIGGGDWVGGSTIATVMSAPETWQGIRNSLVWIVLSVLLTVGLGIVLGNYLSRETAIARAVRTLMLLPWVLPGVVVAAIWKWGFNSQTGFINDTLIRTGVVEQGYPWLGSPTTSLFAVVAVMVWRLFPLYALVIAGAIQTLDTSMFEAAEVDGASRVQVFRYITLPSIKQYAATMGLLVTIWVANNLVFVQVMTGGGPIFSSNTLPVYLYDLAFDSLALSQSAVVSVLNLVVLFVIGTAYIIVSRRGERNA